jgi:hypothetical protein
VQIILTDPSQFQYFSHARRESVKKYAVVVCRVYGNGAWVSKKKLPQYQYPPHLLYIFYIFLTVPYQCFFFISPFIILPGEFLGSSFQNSTDLGFLFEASYFWQNQ